MSTRAKTWIALICGLVIFYQMNTFPGIEGWLIVAFYVVGAVMVARGAVWLVRRLVAG